jgi:hypothetical protein
LKIYEEEKHVKYNLINFKYLYMFFHHKHLLEDHSTLSIFPSRTGITRFKSYLLPPHRMSTEHRCYRFSAEKPGTHKRWDSARNKGRRVEPKPPWHVEDR